MKLVTGIEAIQSGKPWKHQVDEDWRDDGTRCTFIIGSLRKKEFVIKEEPREFWVFIGTSEGMNIYPGNYAGANTSGAQWLRVREIEK